MNRTTRNGRHQDPAKTWGARPLTPALKLALIGALVPTAAAHGGWFKNTEQAALDHFKDGDYQAAADGFSDPYRRGVALYRARRFADAAQAFQEAVPGGDAQSARYNLGNARFQLGDYTGAALAYEHVLSAEPTDDDAAHNLALARAMLARLEQRAYEHKEEQP
uniref:tetratricopeptide repeat protein n=1 Tax=uncultured Lamprocystis sp. TaxID=543132 RepID=UPI0025E05A6E